MKKQRPYLIFTIIGILILLIAFLILPAASSKQEFASSLLFNLGFVVLTVVIVNFLWSLFGGQPMEIMLENATKTFELVSDGFNGGMRRAILSSDKFDTSDGWAELLKKADKEVDMMGYSLHNWCKSEKFGMILRDLESKGVTIRIMIMDPCNPAFDAGLNYEGVSGVTRESMVGETVVCEQCVKEIEETSSIDRNSNIQFVKIKNGLTESQIIRIDNYVYVIPYLYSMHTSDSPLFVYKEQEGGFFHKYVREFEGLWKLNQ